MQFLRHPLINNLEINPNDPTQPIWQTYNITKTRQAITKTNHGQTAICHSSERLLRLTHE
jgi:hypothetical protein